MTVLTQLGGLDMTAASKFAAAALTLLIGAQQVNADVCKYVVTTAWGFGCPAYAGATICLPKPAAGGCSRPKTCPGAGPLCFSFKLSPIGGPFALCPPDAANKTTHCITDALARAIGTAAATRTASATKTPTPSSTPTATTTPSATITGAASATTTATATPSATPTFVTSELTCKLKIEQLDATTFQAECFVCNKGPDDSKGFNVRYMGSVPQQIKHMPGVPKNVGLPAQTNSSPVTGAIDLTNFVSCSIVDVTAGGTQWPSGTTPGTCNAELPCHAVTVGSTVTWICGTPVPAFPAVPICP